MDDGCIGHGVDSRGCEQAHRRPHVAQAFELLDTQTRGRAVGGEERRPRELTSEGFVPLAPRGEEVLEVEGAVLLPVGGFLRLDFASLGPVQSRRRSQEGGHSIGQRAQGSHLLERKRRCACGCRQNEGAGGALLLGEKRQ